MKITKSQLIKIIKEELQSERVTPEQAADPNFNYADRFKDSQPPGKMSPREQDALFGEMVGEIEMLINSTKGIKATPSAWAPKVFDKIEAILAKRKG